MRSLQKEMAKHGFESNDNYEYQLNCLLNVKSDYIRCLNIEGDSGRRKTAFANALAQAMAVKYHLYHDFSEKNPPQPDVILPKATDENGTQEPDIESFDQILSEACAFSEADETVLILDQIQIADFRDHIRLYRFFESAIWEMRTGEYYANKKNLLVFLISEKSLYHSLQKISFRIWVGRVSNKLVHYQPQDFNLPIEAKPLLFALEQLFEALGLSPTISEYYFLLEDIKGLIINIEGLKHSIFGWVEGVDRSLLFADELVDLLEKALKSIYDFQCLNVLELTPAEFISND